MPQVANPLARASVFLCSDGDWNALDTSTNKLFLANAYFVSDALVLSRIASATGQPAAAQALARAVQRAESSLSKEKLALFASFEGMVQIDPHAQGDHHNVHQKP
jgi:hypothetical protein